MRRQQAVTLGAAAILALTLFAPAAAQETGPTLVDRNLQVDTAVSGLALPTSIAFIGDGDLLVLEKNTGQVQHVVDGAVAGTAIDLAVNSFSERGLLGIALHPDFPADPGVYLYWTCRTEDPPADPFVPDEETCSDANMLGADTDDVLRVPLLANRIDRFEWDGSALTFDHRLTTIRQFQNDASPVPPGQGDDATGPHGAQPARGNHDGGIIEFGPDGKLYAYVGDAGRRGALANLPCGPTATECDGQEDVTPDDQFGGPEADDAHFTGVILRLNADGSTPTDNPLFAAGAGHGRRGRREHPADLRLRACGTASAWTFDPDGGHLWEQENGEDAFDELNRVEPRHEHRLDPGRRAIDAGLPSSGRSRPPRFTPRTSRISSSSAGGRSGSRPRPRRRCPGCSRSRDPVTASRSSAGSTSSRRRRSGLSWLGPRAAVRRAICSSACLDAGTRMTAVPAPVQPHRQPASDRGGRSAARGSRRGQHRRSNELTESESLLFGTGFGVVTDIETAPDGNVWVVSLEQGEIYQISRR